MLRARPRRLSSAATRAFRREQRTNSAEEPQNVDPGATYTSEPSAAANRKTVNSTSVNSPSLNIDVDELASTMSALKFVPPSVRFGRGGRRGGLSRS